MKRTRSIAYKTLTLSALAAVSACTTVGPDYHVPNEAVLKRDAANADLRVAAANLERTHAVLEEVEEKKRPEVEMAAAPVYGRIAGASNGL
ncbi:MAG TPA: hypothetical protein VGF26_06120, partial [Ramlibacter sp.]